MFSETRYAMNGDLRVAYRASPPGARDIVFVPMWMSCCEVFPELPSLQGWVEAMTSLGRLIFFDQAGQRIVRSCHAGRSADLGAMGRQHHGGVGRSRKQRSGYPAAGRLIYLPPPSKGARFNRVIHYLTSANPSIDRSPGNMLQFARTLWLPGKYTQEKSSEMSIKHLAAATAVGAVGFLTAPVPAQATLCSRSPPAPAATAFSKLLHR
jgi:hypothetical protein